MVFDIKMKDFRGKAGHLADMCMTQPPAAITYVSAISNETVYIALMIHALNDLLLKAADMLKHLMTPVMEKLQTTLGPNFYEEEGKASIIFITHGMKIAGASLMKHLAHCMFSIGYKPCNAKSNLWYVPMVRQEYTAIIHPSLLCQ